MSTTLIGPAWSTTATPLVDAGRFPLGVEAATLTNSARLVPLVNSGTAHPRYLLLHHAIARSNPAGAGQADRLEATRQLVRRAEVVLGAASLRHAETSPGEHHASAPLRDPHGTRVIQPALDESGSLNLKELAASYSRQNGGFLAVYRGAEIEAGLLDPLNATILPGPVAIPDDALEVIRKVVQAASAPTLSITDLDALLPEACMCQARCGPERGLLTHLLLDAPASFVAPAPRTIRQARRRTAASARLLMQALEGQPAETDATRAMTALCVENIDSVPQAFRDWADHWRGALLRNASVTAWRWLWWWLTERLADRPRSRADLGDALAESLAASAGSNGRAVKLLLESAPKRVEDAQLLDVETNLLYPEGHEADDPWTYLQVLAVGTRRIDDLDSPHARAAFLERGQLGPIWLAAWMRNRESLTVRELGRELAALLIAKAEDISHQRMRWEAGQLRVPTRLREIGDVLDLAGSEGSDAPGLRLERLRQVLEELAFIDLDDDDLLSWGSAAWDQWPK